MSSAGMAQGMQQSMAATAAMQLFMRTLQAGTMELAEIAAQAMATNPALEELPPPEPEDDEPGAPLNREATLRHDRLLENQTGIITLAEHLEEQIRRSALPTATEQAALALIPYLNRHGFFAEPLAELQSALKLPPQTFRRAIQAIRDLEPAGVGAQDLRESLILQLERLGEHGGIPMQLLRRFWQELVDHRYADVARALDVEEEAVCIAARHIARLNPDPGSGFSQTELNIITPDLLVQKEGDEWIVTLTDEDIPRLTISAEYRDMMSEHAEDAELRRYLSKCFRDGRELIRAIAERQQTILKVAQAIVNRQQNFFRHGPHKLAPMQMDSIAADIGVSTSTVSRAVRAKYLKCAHGIFELRRFFSAAVEKTAGEDISVNAVMARIRELIANEPPHAPLSDAAIESALQAEGINLARRTIAKYREQMKILPARLRRSK